MRSIKILILLSSVFIPRFANGADRIPTLPLSGKCLGGMCALFVASQIYSRASAYQRINNNDLRENDPDHRELAALSDKFGPMWLVPDFNPYTDLDEEGYKYYIAARERDMNHTSLGSHLVPRSKPRTIMPTRISLFQSAAFSMQAANYYLKAFGSIPGTLMKQVLPAPVIDDDVIATFVINSSIGAFSKVTPVISPEAGILLTFDRGGFALPYSHLREKFDNRLKIVIFVPRVHNKNGVFISNVINDGDCDQFVKADVDAVIQNTTGAEVREFSFGDSSGLSSVTDQNDRMHLIVNLLAIVTHPIVHSFSDAYICDIMDAKDKGDLHWAFERIASYGNAFNDIASFPGIPLSGRYDPWIAKMQDYNSRLPVPPSVMHATSSTFLAKYSRIYYFLSQAHAKLAKIWHERKNKVDDNGFKIIPEFGRRFDMEAFFLGSIYHSIDHHAVGLLLAPYYVGGGKAYNEGYLNIVNSIFFASTSQIWGSNLLRDHRKDHSFYEDLFESLESIDSVLAHTVSLGISE